MRLSLALATLTACYEPDLADCTVACSVPDECGGDQVCVENVCRSPGATCEGDGPNVPRVALHVDVMGPGTVAVSGLGTCDDHGDCTWMIASGARVELEALPHDDKELERWTTANCAGEDASCTLTATAATLVGVKFK